MPIGNRANSPVASVHRSNAKQRTIDTAINPFGGFARPYEEIHAVVIGRRWNFNA